MHMRVSFLSSENAFFNNWWITSLVWSLLLFHKNETSILFQRKIPPRCEWSQFVVGSCCRFTRALFFLCVFGVNGRRWIPERPGKSYLGEHRRDAGSLVSPRGGGASTSISHAGKLPPSYLTPFILGFMNLQARKSEHMDAGRGKWKRHRFHFSCIYTSTT